MNVLKLTEKVSVRSFDDWADFLEFSQGVRKDDVISRSSRETLNKEWYGTKSFEEAVQLAKYGWPEGLKLIEALSSKVKVLTSQLVVRPQTQYAIAGDCVDIGRFVTGEPENMMVFEDEVIQGGGKVLTVRIDLSASAAVSAEKIMMRGAAALAMVDCLEMAGRSCEIVLTICCSANYKPEHERDFSRIESLIMLKKAGGLLEMDLLAFSIAHPASFRRIAFSAWELEPPEIIRALGIGAGYGYPCAPKDCPADIIVPSMLGTDGKKILAWIEEELVKQGIETERL